MFGFRPQCPYNYTATLKKEVLEGSRPKSQQYEAQLQFCPVDCMGIQRLTTPRGWVTV
jgi:hypothetical protein